SLTIGGGGSGNFANHFTSTDKPNAKYIGVWNRQFLVLGNLNDEVGTEPNSCRWSALGNSTDMDEDQTTLADRNILNDEYGAVQRIVPGVEYGIVFQERAIQRADFVNIPAIFDFNVVDRMRGTPIPRSVTWYGRWIYYIAEEGFMRFDGANSEPLGDSKVDRNFWAQFDIANAVNVSAAIDEKPGAGEPVLQGAADVTVFFDYPGRRLQYVQWAAQGMANLPNQYYNWGVYVPRDYEVAKVKRLSVTFHDSQQRFLRPPWFHRGDTVLLSPHDFPFKSFGYGYHEALGTLRSFKQGSVRPYFGRRVDAVVDWALKKFGADATRVSCGGSGYWAGTAALQYGLRRFGRIAYVMADRHPDPDPRQTVPGKGRRRGRLPRLIMDASWGKPDWAC
ncbi:hypothetical protein LCGC14_2873750, partial [marine sediment metagenome]